MLSDSGPVLLEPGVNNLTRSALTVTDQLQRPLRDLRISVTDRCNFRCAYCMPRTAFGKGFVFLQRAELLSFEEIVRVARLSTELGVRKIRLSGGEPLLRHGVERLIEQLAKLQDHDGNALEIAMTSNGSVLASKARGLKDAGLTRLTVSLDALDDTLFRQMSDSETPVGRVLDGIEAAQAAGLAPVKVNCVVKRGVNEQEILPLVRYFRHRGIVLRFIEFMDVGSTNAWCLDEVVPASEILMRIGEEFPLQALEANYRGEVAERWAFADGAGEIGVIASVTQAFCGDCSRLRLSTDGKLYTCLFAESGYDLRSPLRAGENDTALLQRVHDLWGRRTDRYSQRRSEATAMAVKKIEMSYIGG